MENNGKYNNLKYLKNDYSLFWVNIENHFLEKLGEMEEKIKIIYNYRNDIEENERRNIMMFLSSEKAKILEIIEKIDEIKTKK